MATEVNKRILILIAVIIAVFGVVVSLVINMYHPLSEEYVLEMKIKVIDKQNLGILYKIGNVTVVDCSPDNHPYKEGRKLPYSVWSTNPSMFYNTTKSLVVYSYNDTVSHDFCIDIIRNSSVEPFLFEGGYAAWQEGS